MSDSKIKILNSKAKSLYIHIPFCLKKCPYCDFVSYDDKIQLSKEYIQALEKEFVYYYENYDLNFETLFVGGGTPSALNDEDITNLFKAIYKYVDKKKIKEATIEVNPETVTKEKLDILDGNVNRISMGAQSFNNNFLKTLGRVHNSEKIYEAARLIKAKGFDNFNLDLIFGVPGQKIEDVIFDINEAIKLSCEHISFYMLTLYEGTLFYESKIKQLDDQFIGEMYLSGVEKLEKSGYRQYEISNFTKGRKCEHNLNYWNLKEYIGIGVSAASYFNQKRFKNFDNIEKYIYSIKNNKRPLKKNEEPGENNYLKEYIMLKLRLSSGIKFKEFKEKFGFDFIDRYSNIIDKIKKHEILNITDNSISLTKKGFLVSNEIINRFF